MNSYQEFKAYFVNKIKDFSEQELLEICQFVIGKIAQTIPNDFADGELEEEQPLLMDLKQCLSHPNISTDEIKNIIHQLDEICEQYGGEYPACMDFFPIALIKTANNYQNICNHIDDKNNIMINLLNIIMDYFDCLECCQQLETDVDMSEWENYPYIQQGIQELNNFLKNYECLKEQN